MRNVEIINEQYRVTVDEYTVILLCDELYWYLKTSLGTGIMDCGKPVQLFDNEIQMEEYVLDNNLIEYISDEQFFNQ